MFSAISPENPFRPGSELQRETDELMRRSVFLRDKVYIPDDLAAPSAPTTPQPTLSRPDSNGSQKHVRIQSKDGGTDFPDGPNSHAKNGIAQSEAVEEQVSASKTSGGLQSAAPIRNNPSANGEVAAGAQAVEKSVQKKRKRAACCPVSWTTRPCAPLWFASAWRCAACLYISDQSRLHSLSLPHHSSLPSHPAELSSVIRSQSRVIGVQ